MEQANSVSRSFYIFLWKYSQKLAKITCVRVAGHIFSMLILQFDVGFFDVSCLRRLEMYFISICYLISDLVWDVWNPNPPADGYH